MPFAVKLFIFGQELLRNSEIRVKLTLGENLSDPKTDMASGAGKEEKWPYSQ